jgi:hypothetical protein
MKDHDHKRRAKVGRGGKARLRLSAFQQARGITDATAAQFSSVYTAGVLQAIALAAAPGAPAPASLPQWRLVGPDLVANGQTWAQRPDGTWQETSVSGRVSAVAVDPKNSNHILCGSGGGGVWESFNRGASWAPRTDFQPTLAIGAIAFDPNNSLTVYAGTGEGNKYWFLGQGLLRSADGGTTWSMLTTGPFVGNGFFQIIVDPANSKHILAATYRGLYASTDGGSTFQATTLLGTVWDISMQPGGGPTSEVLAATDSGLWASADSGQTWAAAAIALPNAPANWERLGVSIGPPDPTPAPASGPAYPNVAYAFGASMDNPPVATLWRRSGSAWTAVALPPGDLGTRQAYYDWYVAAARDRTDQVYIGIFDVFRGDLSGVTWTWTNMSSKPTGDSIHPDQHALVFDPNDPSTIYCGCDGGLFRSPDRGVSWIPLNAGLATYEMEYAAQDNASSRWLLAGLQDNGSLRYAGTSAFEQVTKGDGGDCGVDQTHPSTCYVSYTKMGLYISTQKGLNNTFNEIDATSVMQVPANYSSLFYPPMGAAGSTVAQAGQSVFVSRDATKTWTEVKLPAANPPSSPVMTALYLPTTDLIYAATANGRVFKLTYAGTAWSIAELASPRAAYVSAIRVDSSSRIWVTMSEAGGGRVWRSDDGGTTWTDKTGSLPGFPINSIAFDDNTVGRVWVSADLGVYQSLDSGATWATFFQNLPNTLVTDLEFHNGDRLLRATTRNRGIWEAAVDKPGNSALAPRVQGLSPVLNRTNGYEVFTVGAGGAPYHTWQSGPTTGWSGWNALGSGAVVSSSLVSALNTDGRNEVFGRGMDGALWHNCHIAPNNFGWTGWSSLGGFLTGDLAVAANQDGRLQVFARGKDGMLGYTYQTTASTSTAWSAWASLGVVITSTPAVALNSDGRMEVFARGLDGTLGHIAQTSASSVTGWSAWESLGGKDFITSRPAAAQNSDGRLEVLARGPEGGLRSISQTAAGGASGWSAWLALGGATIGDPSVARLQDGRLVAFVRKTEDGSVRNIYQSSPGTWSGSTWESRGGAVVCDPVVVCRPEGRLEAWAVGTDNGLCTVWQTAANSAWTWTNLGGTITMFPST